MKLMRNRRSTVVTACAVVSTGAASIAVSSEIPFDPPIVHRGWSPSLKRAIERDTTPAPSSGTRNLMFQDQDRRHFQAIHPFLLHETNPQMVTTPGERKTPRRKRLSVTPIAVELVAKPR